MSTHHSNDSSTSHLPATAQGPPDGGRSAPLILEQSPPLPPLPPPPQPQMHNPLPTQQSAGRGNEHIDHMARATSDGARLYQSGQESQPPPLENMSFPTAAGPSMPIPSMAGLTSAQWEGIRRIISGMNAPALVVDGSEQPYTDDFRNAPMPANFHMPTFCTFSGEKDPRDHINAFANAMQFYTTDKRVYARAFPLSLTSFARAWFNRLPAHSIDSWTTLSSMFVTKFGSKVSIEHEVDALLEIVQEPGESIRSFSTRFERMAALVPKANDATYIMAYKQGLLHGDLRKAILIQEPTNQQSLTHLINEYIKVEESQHRRERLDVRRAGQAQHPRSPKRVPAKDRLRQPSPRRFDVHHRPGNHQPIIHRRSPKHDRGRYQRRSRSPYRQPVHQRLGQHVVNSEFTPLVASVGEIYAQLPNKHVLPSPTRIRKPTNRRGNEEWCEYHRDHGHTTDNCRHLKLEIEKLIKRGFLGEYVDRNRTRNEVKPESPQNARLERAPNRIP